MTDNITDLGHVLTVTACEIYAQVLEKFGLKITSKYLKDSSQEDKEEFIKRLKEQQTEKLQQRLTLILNRVVTDHDLLEQLKEKSLDASREEYEIINNQLQSVENECSNLQRDTHYFIEKLEKLSEEIMEQ